MLSTYDIDLICRDTALPGLSMLLDTEAFAALLQQSVPEIGPVIVNPTYVRYKPGMNCLVAYDLTVGGDATMAYAKAHRSQDLEKIEKASALESRATAFGPGRIVIKDAAIVISFFPNDNKLRSLIRLANDSTRQRLLERVFAGHLEFCTGAVQTLRYKPERRYVAGLSTAGQTVATLKFYPRPTLRSVLKKTRQFTPGGPLKLASRLGHSSRHGILAFEWLSGDLLSDMLSNERPDDNAVMTVGAALAALHGQKTNRLPLLSADRHATALQGIADGLAHIWPEIESKAQDLATQFGRELDNETNRLCPIHGDFYASQVLLSDNAAAIIDLDESALGNPAIDPGNFIAHLERNRLSENLSSEHTERISRALLEGYSNSGHSLSRREVDLYTAVGLFQLAPHPFRYREPDWPVRIEEILDRAETLLHRASRPHPFFSSCFPPSAPERAKSAVSSVKDYARMPEDIKMPYLQRALQTDEAWMHCQPIFEALTHRTSRLSLRPPRLVRYKQGRRCLIEYTVEYQSADGERLCCTIMGKSRAKGLDSSTHELMHTLWNGAFHEHAVDDIVVPQPLGAVPAFNMWFQRKVDGRVATSLLNEPEGPQRTRDIARALHKLQQSGPSTLRVHTIEDELAILDKRLPLVSELHPEWNGRISALLTGCHELAEQLPETPHRPVHRDFYPDNILLAESKVCLLDFDLYSFGDPALDAGNFVGHLIEHSLRIHGNPNHLQSSQQAFEDTFVALAGKALRPAIRIYTTLTLARHVHISSLFPERYAFMEALLALCEERMVTHAHCTTPIFPVC